MFESILRRCWCADVRSRHLEDDFGDDRFFFSPYTTLALSLPSCGELFFCTEKITSFPLPLQKKKQHNKKKKKMENWKSASTQTTIKNKEEEKVQRNLSRPPLRSYCNSFPFCLLCFFFPGVRSGVGCGFAVGGWVCKLRCRECVCVSKFFYLKNIYKVAKLWRSTSILYANITSNRPKQTIMLYARFC